MNYGYIRVSSDKQTVENQRFERLLRRTTTGDLIICSELSRLGRSLYMIMDILSLCMKRGCRVWTVKDGYRLGDDIQSKVLAFAFALSAEIERNLISQRTKEALARLKAEGKPLGRPKGSRSSQTANPMYRHDAYIRRALIKGYSRRELSRRLHCSRTTLSRYINTYILASP